MTPTRRDELVDAALNTATPILYILGKMLDLSPVPGLGLIPEGLSALVNRIKDSRANDKSRKAFIAQVQILGSVIQQMTTETDASVANYDGNVHERRRIVDGVAYSEELQGSVRELLSTIGELGQRVNSLKGGTGLCGSLKGLMYASRNEDALLDMKEDLARAIVLFKLRGQLAVQKCIQEIERLLKEAEEEKKLDSVPRTPAGYQALTVNQLKGDFTKGTRKGLFEELKLWSNGRFPGDEPKRVYFLSGGAGLGKSAIAHQLCTRLNGSVDSPRVGASYFFVRSDEGLSSGHLFFSTLLHQLALSQSTLRPHIITSVREYLQHGDQQNLGYASKDLLRMALRKVSASDHSPVFLVVDGLDECKERDLLPRLLRSLLELIREVPWLWVFVASRPEPHIMAVLVAPEARDVVHSRSLDDALEDLKGDVKLYLEVTVPRISCYAAFLRDHPDALERLSERAAGVFIYARIAVRFLDTYHDHPEEQFELLFSPGRAPWLSPLDALYLQVLRSAFPPADLHQALPARRERLLSVLQIIALRRRALTSRCIARLGSGLSEDDVVGIVDSLRSVLLIGQDGTVRPLHATFPEFLLDAKRCEDTLYHVDKGEGHARLASSCLAAFSFANVVECLAKPDSAVGQHVSYAALVWSEHFRDAVDPGDELGNRLRTFVQGDNLPIYTRTRLVLPSVYRETQTRRQVVDLHTNTHRCVRHMVQFLKVSGDARKLCSEYVMLTAYTNQWYWEAVRNPNEPPDHFDLDPDSVTAEVGSIASGCPDDLGLGDLTVQPTDIARFQAVHAKLARDICGDGQARKLWYPTHHAE